MGELIRILPGTYEERPSTLCCLVLQREVFFTFFPVSSALKSGIIRRVATIPTPPTVRNPPLMRSPGRINTLTRRVESWWLWDGVKAWCVDDLTDEQKQYSLKSICNDTLLIERIKHGWRPTDYT